GGIAYIKEEASTGSIEIVTHPMSLDWAMQNFPWEVLSELKALGSGTDDAGLHIHVNRNGFDSVIHTYWWLRLVYDNEREVSRLARRVSDMWAAFRQQDRENLAYYASGGRSDI